MPDTIPFSCPSCEGKTFTLAAKPESYEDFVGAPCTECGRVLTKKDIERQATAIATRLAREAFKKVRF